jgi:hypothetical protein
MTTDRSILSVLLAAPLLMLSACGESPDTKTTQSTDAPTPAWVLASAPAQASDVATAKQSAEEGDQITLRGRIGGRKDPIADGSPVFTIVDLAIPHCKQLHGDRCPTPWDYCCEDPRTLTDNAATVQIVDAQGRPIDASPAAHGFAPLDEVIVVGSVAPRPDDRVLTVRATAVHRVQ